MRKLFYLAIICVATLFLAPYVFTNAQIKKHIKHKTYQDGDIIFQSSKSRQCEAVKLATHSNISHCGMLFQEEGNWFVIEAVEPVQIVSLSSFIARGEDKHYTIKRLKSIYNQLDDAKISSMNQLGKRWIGKHYDIYFSWNNDEIYCSELVWKLYHDGAQIDLCALKKLKDYDLSSPLVKTMMNERYGKNVPLNEEMVAPSDIYNSDKLELVDQQ